jgi:hypothetical protein
MGRTLVYRCDLCNVQDDPDRLIGFGWSEEWMVRDMVAPQDARRHICPACARAVARIVQRRDAPMPAATPPSDGAAP